MGRINPGKQKPCFTPTPEEIQAECQKIQEEWEPGEEARRRGETKKYRLVFEYEPRTFRNEYPEPRDE